jgi:propanediol utilization protein
VELSQGVICAARHIHMSPDDALRFGVKDKDVVGVRVESPARTLVFENVLVRVHPDFQLDMHIDTDESNSADIGVGASGRIV